uniref:SPK domain-containing protein n=1 Tax=Caenorhabditis japonica TaxID=281687 RepID=A0A8R1EQ69_CAEJA
MRPAEPRSVLNACNNRLYFTELEDWKIIQYVVEKAKKAEFPVRRRKFFSECKAATKVRRPIRVMEERFLTALAPKLVKMSGFDTETKVRVLFALSVPIDPEFLEEVIKVSIEIRVSEKGLICTYRNKNVILRRQPAVKQNMLASGSNYFGSEGGLTEFPLLVPKLHGAERVQINVKVEDEEPSSSTPTPTLQTMSVKSVLERIRDVIGSLNLQPLLGVFEKFYTASAVCTDKKSQVSSISMALETALTLSVLQISSPVTPQPGPESMSLKNYLTTFKRIVFDFEYHEFSVLRERICEIEQSMKGGDERIAISTIEQVFETLLVMISC